MGDLNKSAIADHMPPSNHAVGSVNGVGGGRSCSFKKCHHAKAEATPTL